MNDSGLLRLIELTPEKYRLLAQAQVLKGRESWGPLAIAGGLLLRSRPDPDGVPGCAIDPNFMFA